MTIAKVGGYGKHNHETGNIHIPKHVFTSVRFGGDDA